ncbi:MAG: EAL domain-containing protein [Clostridiales bacterium]|nr:EAL domain-containing protein [Clostridiales bacterium]
MPVDLTDIYELITTCEDFDGTLIDSSALRTLTSELKICNVSYRIFSQGVNTESSVIYSDSSLTLGENYDLSRETSDSRVVVVRIYRTPDAEPLTGDNKVLFSIFHEIVLSGVLVWNLVNAYNKVMYSDFQTGITNYNYFLRMLASVIMDRKQDEYTAGYVNIKNCRVMNKIFGSEKTDKILKDYAQEMSVFFESDNKEIFSRLGGDNFVFLIRNEKLDETIRRLDNVRISLEYDEDIVDYQINVRMGIVRLGSRHLSPSQIMSDASSAFSLSRRPGTPDITFYSDNTDSIINNEKEYMEEIKRDLENGRFLVYYQPIVRNSGNLELIGAEALVRWRRHDRMVNPLSFIPVAEKFNFISKIDLYVLENVCIKLREWIDMGIDVVPVSCNFSQYDLLTDSLPDKIIEIIDKYKIDHSLINIEFKEAGFHEEYEAFCYSAQKLISEGVKISVDNFGSGFSSLILLSKLDFNFLKIDRSIVTSKDAKANIIIDSIITMAERLGLTVVCEGIETTEDIERIMNSGCNIFQTDFYDKAMSERFFLNRLRNPKYQ